MKQLLRQGLYVVLAQATVWQYYTAFKILIVLTIQGVFLWSGLLGFKNPLLDFNFCFVCIISTCVYIHISGSLFFGFYCTSLLVCLKGSSFRKAAGVKQRLQSTTKFCSLRSLCLNFAIFSDLIEACILSFVDELRGINSTHGFLLIFILLLFKCLWLLFKLIT